MSREELEARLLYSPTARAEGKVPRYESIRSTAVELGVSILAYTPESREQSIAITKLEEALMWAIAAIARE